MEYVKIQYDVNPNHSTYKSDGYHYTQPFPNMRLAYKLNDNNKLSVFYNRRVDRPNEVDIRIFLNMMMLKLSRSVILHCVRNLPIP